MAGRAVWYQHVSSMDIPFNGPTFSLRDSIAFDSKINDQTKVKTPTKETHSLIDGHIIIKLFCGESMLFHVVLFIGSLFHCAILAV